MAQKSAAVLLCQRLYRALSAPVCISLTGPLCGLPVSVRSAGRRAQLPAGLVPARRRAADCGIPSDSRAGAVCRGAAGLSGDLRKLHAHQRDQHGRKCCHKFCLADPLQHRQEPFDNPFATDTAACDAPLPCAAETRRTEASAPLAAGACVRWCFSWAAGHNCKSHAFWSKQAAFRVPYLLQREHLHRQQL